MPEYRIIIRGPQGKIIDKMFDALDDVEAGARFGNDWNAHAAHLPNRGIEGALYRGKDRIQRIA